MSISTEEKDRYLRETAIVLAREGFQTGKTDSGKLRVLLDGAPLCEVTENGGITYRNEDINEPERVAAKDMVYEIVRNTAEYMRQMETAPFLKADGLEDGYKVLADFNDIVLAGIQSKYGVQFVTWDWSFDRKGVSHGHYYHEFYIFRVVRPNSMSQTAGSEYEEVIITNYDPRKACWQLSLESLLNCGSEARYELIHEPERPIKTTN